MIDKSMAEAQCLNQSFEFGPAKQQISKPFTMLLHSGTAVIQSCLCCVKLIHKFPKCVFEKLYFFASFIPDLKIHSQLS